MPEMTDHSKPHDAIFGVMPCCGAPLVAPMRHHHWCPNFTSESTQSVINSVSSYIENLKACHVLLARIRGDYGYALDVDDIAEIDTTLKALEVKDA